MTRYLDLEDALHILQRYGFVMRDAGLLASALARAAATFEGAALYDSIELQAAALLESLTRNHALVDGNKRTAWTLMVLFLWINGLAHKFDTDTAFDLVLGVGKGRVTLEGSARVIAAHLVRRS
ncbi:MAG: Fic family protein [Microbacterium sp.]|uniref:type II toxin-antitoxin system death-on-curing family toxin n=1 Tax=Microbacterium sp. TaxID=51671 RepID=UPI0039E3B296